MSSLIWASGGPCILRTGFVNSHFSKPSEADWDAWDEIPFVEVDQKSPKTKRGLLPFVRCSRLAASLLRESKFCYARCKFLAGHTNHIVLSSPYGEARKTPMIGQFSGIAQVIVERSDGRSRNYD
ncbi:hypothetical protein CISG_06575 [Coccidioides immitis RMSCC 3703]|uniref:Uncharacterized protein n=1 Tax=Coccidioides immitis RMSCC 3703 TaxID=454286 RepID=A0A0J8QZL5_COCIT|nr:hypothetical protein CISG_06575 [Coccidioides immitis RMSCC 3703]